MRLDAVLSLALYLRVDAEPLDTFRLCKIMGASCSLDLLFSTRWSYALVPFAIVFLHMG